MYRWHSINLIPELYVSPADGNRSIAELTLFGYVFVWEMPFPLTRGFATPAIGPYWSRKNKEFYF